MCGLLAFFGGGVTLCDIKDALGKASFRGPDASGSSSGENFKLAHCRLKIFDLSDSGNQPFKSRSGRYSIVYNGEIYNFRELANQFDLELHTTCDTEVLLELYELLGPDMLGHLNGMFSFVIVENETGRFFAARDRLGIKPLYWAKDKRGMFFASEPASIVNLLGHVTIDDFSIRQYKKLRSCFGSRTLYKEIKVFPAAHYYHEHKMTKYWELPQGEQLPPSDEELKELISSAVHYRMQSDVPLGAYLSGGLDSSIIVSLAGDIETWSVGSKERNEKYWAGKVANHLGVRFNYVDVESSAYCAAMESMVTIRKEPLSVPNDVLIYLMSSQVKTRNTVVLGGEGADELFFGYDRIFRWAAQSEWDVKEFDRLYSYSKHDDIEVVEDAVSEFVNSNNCLQTVSQFFQVAHLQVLLRRLDFATMLAGVEARVPFVDHRLVERMANVPFGYRMENGVVKAPLKRIFSDSLPYEILHRKKVGFPVDLPGMLDKAGAGYDEYFSMNLKFLKLEEHGF